jgi:hypothetical protein
MRSKISSVLTNHRTITGGCPRIRAEAKIQKFENRF